jgi:MFS family permease
VDVRGVALSGLGLLGIVWAVIRAGTDGWERIDVMTGLGGGVLALAGFVAWELRAPDPTLPMRFPRNRTFAAGNVTALLMYAALFGVLFLVSQLLQAGLGASPLEAGVRMLPMTVMPMLLTPVAGALSDPVGTRPLMIAGVALVAAGSAGLAAVTSPDVRYLTLAAPLVLLGAGSALFFAPIAATVLGAVTPHEQGMASGATTAIRELAVTLGIALLATVFAGYGDLSTRAGVMAGVVPALWLAAALATARMLAAIAMPRAGKARSADPRQPTRGTTCRDTRGSRP